MDETRRTATKFDIDALLHPAAAYDHPMDVLQDADLSLNEKRPFSLPGPQTPARSRPRRICGAKGVAERFRSTTSWSLKVLDGEAHSRTDYGKLVNRVRRVRDLYGRGEGGSGGIFLS